MQPQLALSLEDACPGGVGLDDYLVRLVADPERAVSQKLNGVRLLVTADGKMWNRRGEKSNIDDPKLFAALRKMHGIAFDGEYLPNGEYWVFDIPSTQHPFRETYGMLSRLELPEPIYLLSQVMDDPKEKVSLIRRIVDEGGEGTILRDVNARYKPGVRDLTIVKQKNWRTCDAILWAPYSEGKDRVCLALLDDKGEPVDVGAARILPSLASQVKTGAVAEVRYLYVGENSRLYQPHLLQIRTDKRPQECYLTQIEHHRVNRSVIPLPTAEQ